MWNKCFSIIVLLSHYFVPHVSLGHIKSTSKFKGSISGVPTQGPTTTFEGRIDKAKGKANVGEKKQQPITMIGGKLVGTINKKAKTFSAKLTIVIDQKGFPGLKRGRQLYLQEISLKGKFLKTPKLTMTGPKKELPYWLSQKVEFTFEGDSTTEPIQNHCGEANQKSNGRRIINGEETGMHEFPWTAYIMAVYKMGQSKDCGGAILSKQFVLTAAHCVKDMDRNGNDIGIGNKPINANRLKVYVGVHSIKKKGPLVQNKVTVQMTTKKIFMYMNTKPVETVNRTINCHLSVGSERPRPVTYKGLNFLDIALIFLKSKISFDFFKSPICLPDPDDDFDFIGEEVTVAGWGLTEDGKPSPILKKMIRKLVSPSETLVCKGINLEKSLLSLELMLKERDPAAGKGDSGSPYNYVAEDDLFMVIGVHSRGLTRRGTTAVPPKASHGMKLTKDVNNWIRDVMKENEKA